MDHQSPQRIGYLGQKNQIPRSSLVCLSSLSGEAQLVLESYFFTFHISNSIIRKVRDMILKYLIKNKEFVRRYLGGVYKE